jgi:hypothetical protein
MSFSGRDLLNMPFLHDLLPAEKKVIPVNFWGD